MLLTSWELWAGYEGDDDTSVAVYAFGPAPYGERLEADYKWRLIWTVEASSYNDAQRKKHEYLGWESYKPMPGTE